MGPERQQLVQFGNRLVVVKRRLVVLDAGDPRARSTGSWPSSSRRQLGELSEHGRKLGFGLELIQHRAKQLPRRLIKCNWCAPA
jgi:hypothetical protein